MNKITGIKSVDFKVMASGYGVVNYNGSTELVDGNESRDNHLMPKLRGYTNLSGQVSEKGYKFKKDVRDIDFTKTPMYVSANCIRHWLFKEQAYDLHFATKNNLSEYISSISGLVRGLVFTGGSSSFKRKSPLLLTDFIDTLHNGNFEQFVRSGKKKDDNTELKKDGKKKKSTSIFSKTTFGETSYIGHGSINIEDLQFISLDNKFDRAVINTNVDEAIKISKQIEELLISIDSSKNPKAVFNENYVRVGSIYKEGEIGILLNDDAISILVEVMLEKIKELSFTQARGYLTVDDIEVDYNDNKLFRIKHSINDINSTKSTNYAVYYTIG